MREGIPPSGVNDFGREGIRGLGKTSCWPRGSTKGFEYRNFGLEAQALQSLIVEKQGIRSVQRFWIPRMEAGHKGSR
jgi:hypothetical protein